MTDTYWRCRECGWVEQFTEVQAACVEHGVGVMEPVAVVPLPEYERLILDRVVAAVDWERYNALDSEVERLRALLRAVEVYVAKWAIIEADPQYQGVWFLAASHGMPYTGPRCEDEMNALRAELLKAAKGETR